MVTPADNRSGPRRTDDAGFALIAVILLAAVLVMLALVAFGDIAWEQNSGRGVNTTAQADAAAQTGLAAAKYDISVLSTACSLPWTGVVTSGAPANTPASSYSVSVNYYTTTTPNSADADTCNATTNAGVTTYSLASAAQSATILSTGAANVGGKWSAATANNLTNVASSNSSGAYVGGNTSTETIEEQVSISGVSANSYVIFAGSSLTTSVNNQLTVSASNATPPLLGEIYVNGNFSTGTAGCPGAGEDATLVTSGNLTLDSCTVDGSVAASGNILLQNGASIGASSSAPSNATASNGSIVMDGSNIYGNAVARGSSSSSIQLCPKSTTPTSPCSQLPSSTDTGASTIWGSADASGTVTEGISSEEANAPYYEAPPCSAVSDKVGGDNNAIDGCITTQDSSTSANVSSSLGLPTIAAPTTAGNSWTGYTLDANANCNSGSDPNSVYNLLASSTPQVIVLGSSCSGVLNFSTNITLTANMAVFAPNGISLAQNFKFATAGGNTSKLQLSLIVPTPTSSYSCGTASSPSYSITINGKSFPNPAGASPYAGIYEDFYTPCYMSLPTGAVTAYGSMIAEYYNFLNSSGQAKGQLTISYNPFAPPGLTWGYVVQTEQHFVVQG